MKNSALLSICGSFALIVICSCDDQAFTPQNRTQTRIESGAVSIAEAAHRASLDRVAAAEELRAAAAPLAEIPSANAAQARAIASLRASALTQAAMLELGRASQLESANRSARALVSGYVRVIDEIQIVVSARASGGFGEQTSNIDAQVAGATSEQRTAQSAQEELAETVAALKTMNESAIADAQELLLEAEAIRVRVESAPLGQIAPIAEEAGRKRDEARARQVEAERGNLQLTLQEIELRKHTKDAEDAANRVKVLQQALATLTELEANIKSSSEKEGGVSSELQTTVLTLVASISSSASDTTGACYQRAATDLELAESLLAQGDRNEVSTIEIGAGRARSLIMRGEGEFQQALLFDSLAQSPSMNEKASNMAAEAAKWLLLAQTSTRDGIAAYKALQETLANSSAETSTGRALAKSIDRSLKNIRVPVLGAVGAIAASPEPAAADATDAAAEPVASDTSPPAGEDGAAAGPPFNSAEALGEFLTRLDRDPESAARIDELLIATTPEGQDLAATVFGPAKAIGRVQLAMKTKFGTTELGALSAMVKQGPDATATVADATDESAIINLEKGPIVLAFNATRTEQGWKLDLDATSTSMDQTLRSQLNAAGGMLGALIAGLDEVTAEIESGQIESAPAVQQAIMIRLQKAMSEMSGAGDP